MRRVALSASHTFRRRDTMKKTSPKALSCSKITSKVVRERQMYGSNSKCRVARTSNGVTILTIRWRDHKP